MTDPTPQQVIASQLRRSGLAADLADQDAPEVIEALADAGYEIQPISEPADSDDGIDLTDTEATALAWRVCCEAVAALVDAGRLDWEDFPNLTETAWGKVAAAIDSTVVDSIRFTADSYDRAHGLDSSRLHGEATR